MAKIEKTVLIQAPIEKVFAFMADPNNMPEIWPSVLEIKDIQHFPNGKDCYKWVYKMAGMRFDGQTETLEFIQNQRIVTKNEGGIPSTFVWEYLQEDGGTRITMNVDYSLPGLVLARLVEPVIHKMNEQEGETLLANLKIRMEG
jgi:uncharacterized membrane protein